MKKAFHFCGCVTTWRLVAGTWKLDGFSQACDRRWRMAHFGVSRLEELREEAREEADELE